MGYRGLERKVARALESVPLLRRSMKALYHRANYVCFRERGFRQQVHSNVRLLTVGEWAGVPLEPDQGVFFGYYDKSPWSPDMQRVIVHRIQADGRVAIVILDRQRHTQTIVGVSSAWNHQQGSMAQWLPQSSGTKVIFNDYAAGALVSRIVTPGCDELVLPFPIQTVHPGKSLGLSLNYRRLARLRPEYGYVPEATNFAPDQPMDQDGIWEVDLASGTGQLVITLASLAENEPAATMVNSEHKVNHILYSPDGNRFVFLHRWQGGNGRFSRLYVAGSGAKPRLLLDERLVSHFSWADETHVVVWGRTRDAGDHYYLVEVNTGESRVVGLDSLDVYGDGHISLSPDRQWIVTDSYPDRARIQHLLLYHRSTAEAVEVGRFFAPWRFAGAVRCDLHPRWSPDGQWICIDSAHTGNRMTYMLDVSELIAVASARAGNHPSNS